MKGLNKVTLIGNLGKDPEVQYLENNVAIAKFSLATTESYKDKSGNWVDQTEWHNIVLWRWTAERAEKWLRKGSRIYLEGKIRTRSYDDKDGVKKYITEITGDNFMLLDKRDSQDSGAFSEESGTGQAGMRPAQHASLEPSTSIKENAGAKDDFEEDLPF